MIIFEGWGVRIIWSLHRYINPCIVDVELFIYNSKKDSNCNLGILVRRATRNLKIASIIQASADQCCGSEIINFGSGSDLDLNFRSGFVSGLFMKNIFEMQII
jgi:hypothetical protein